MDHNALKKWFLENKRDFPWRKELSPYHVWVSEVMLQQTLAQVVIPYFKRWMTLFPTIEDLANADPKTVIKAWEGLGYYSRARNLQAGAKQIGEKFNGLLPDNFNDLKKIKGIGDYTAGAILSFAFQKKAAAVDGNVMRVISRICAIDDDISQPKTVTLIREKVEQLLPDKDPWVVMEALIELGATVCRKKPECEKCPLRSHCQAYFQGMETELPYKSQKIRYEKLTRTVFVFRCQDALLLKCPQKGVVMQDLYEFPFVENQAKCWSLAQAKNYIQKTWGIQCEHGKKLDRVNHSFTRFRVNLNPMIFKLDSLPEVAGCQWTHIDEIGTLSFSSGHRRILQQVHGLPQAT